MLAHTMAARRPGLASSVTASPRAAGRSHSRCSIPGPLRETCGCRPDARAASRARADLPESPRRILDHEREFSSSLRSLTRSVAPRRHGAGAFSRRLASACEISAASPSRRGAVVGAHLKHMAGRFDVEAIGIRDALDEVRQVHLAEARLGDPRFDFQSLSIAVRCAARLQPALPQFSYRPGPPPPPFASPPFPAAAAREQAASEGRARCSSRLVSRSATSRLIRASMSFTPLPIRSMSSPWARTSARACQVARADLSSVSDSASTRRNVPRTAEALQRPEPAPLRPVRSTPAPPAPHREARSALARFSPMLRRPPSMALSGQHHEVAMLFVKLSRLEDRRICHPGRGVGRHLQVAYQ